MLQRTNSLAVILLVCLGVLALSQVASAGLVWACVPYDGSADICNITIGQPVLAWNSNPHAQFSSVLRGRQFLAFRRIPEPCYTYALIMICATHMRPCLEYNNETLMYPQNPCYHSCKDFVDACEGPFAEAGIPLWAFGYFPSGPYGVPEWTNASQCVMPDALFKDKNYFPTNFTSYTLNNTNITVEQPCFAPPLQLTPAPCTEPLVHDGDLYCSFECPLPSLSDSEYESAKIMQGIVSWFSWVLSWVLIISYVVNPELRKFPKALLIANAFGANILAGGMILPTYAGYDNIWCGGSDIQIVPDTYFYLQGLSGFLGVDSNIDDLTVHSSACSFQGAMLLFGFLSCTFWWAIIAFNMCLEIYLGTYLTDKRWKWAREIVYNVIGWGIPFLFMLIPTSAGKMGFEPAGTFCFVTAEDDDAWLLTFFFIPVGLCLVIGSTLFLASLIKLTIVALKVHKYKEVLVPYIRLLLFVFTFFLVLVLFSAYTINNTANESTVSDGYAEYYQCLTGDTFTPVDQCELNSDVSNYPLVMLKGFALSCLGTLLFFIFFASTSVIKQWYKIFMAIGALMIKRDRVAAIKMLGVVGLQTSSMTSISGTHSINTMTVSSIAEDLKREEEEETNDSEESDTEMEEKKQEESREEGSSSSASD